MCVFSFGREGDVLRKTRKVYWYLFLTCCIYVLGGCQKNEDSVEVSTMKYDSNELGTSLALCELVDETKNTKEIYQGREETNLNCSLYIDGYQLPYDKETSTYYLSVSMEESDWDNQTLSVSKGYEYQLVSSLVEDKLESIRANQTYEVLIYNQSSYDIVHLIVTGMPIMDIKLENGSAKNIGEEDETCLIRVYDPDRECFYSDGSIHIRGNLTKKFDKKSYKIELEDKTSLLGMRKDDDWILYGMYSDESKIRDKVAYDLWNQMQTKEESTDAYGTHIEYVELIVNQEYWGLYGLMEPLDEKQFDINKKAKDGEKEYIYMTNDYSKADLSDFEKEGNQKQRGCFELKSKLDDISLKDWNPLVNYLKIRDSKEEKTFVAGMEQMVNVYNIVNYWIFIQTVTGVDNVYKNMYYVAKKQGEDYRFYFVPWDLNYTFGQEYVDDRSLLFTHELEQKNALVEWKEGARYLSLNVNQAQKVLKQTWGLLRENVLSEQSISDQMDQNMSYLIQSGAFYRDQVRWPDGKHKEDISLMKSDIKSRLQFLDHEFLYCVIDY